MVPGSLCQYPQQLPVKSRGNAVRLNGLTGPDSPLIRPDRQLSAACDNAIQAECAEALLRQLPEITTLGL